MFSRTEEKRLLRVEMRDRRKAVARQIRDKASLELVGRLLSRDDVRRACAERAVVAVYWASSVELDLSAFVTGVLSSGGRIVSPRWNGSSYEMAEFFGDIGELASGPMGILEPSAAAALVEASEISVWIVPGLAFTADGIRLGYGGGWYDRLLAVVDPTATVIGVGYSFQVVGSLPCEPHDCRMTALETVPAT